jgi:ATP-dependent Clp protease protease subunit
VREIRLEAAGSPEVIVTITSDGGNMLAGLDIYDMLRLYPGKTIGIVEGFARSAAPVILQACKVRQCSRHARILIHHLLQNELSLDTMRSPKKMEAVLARAEAEQLKLYHLLALHTGRSMPSIRKLCFQEYDMAADEALEFGLIDEII